MLGSTDPRLQNQARSLFGRPSDRELAVPLIVLVMTLELGWIVFTWPFYSSSEYDWVAGIWMILFGLPIGIGALGAAIAVPELARDRLRGRMAGLIWAAFGAAFAGFVTVAMLTLNENANEPTSRLLAPAVRSARVAFGLATVGSIAVLILLVRDRGARDRPSLLNELSPQVPIDDDESHPRQVWPSSRRSNRRRRRPPRTAGPKSPA
jgi:MFS family permease